MVYGGDEGRCVGESWDKAIGDQLGRICPRVDLESDLELEADLLRFATHPDLRPFAGAKFESMATALQLEAGDAELVLDRVATVLGDPVVVKRLHPAPEPSGE